MALTKLYLFIYLFIITLWQVCQGSASNWCLQPKNTSYTYIIITLTNYNLAIVFESLMVARDCDICCTDIDNGRYSDCHRQNELQNDST